MCSPLSPWTREGVDRRCEERIVELEKPILIRRFMEQRRRRVRADSLPLNTRLSIETQGHPAFSLQHLGSFFRAEGDQSSVLNYTGARLEYLPPYSPDFNPNEDAFSKLEAMLRRAAERSIGGFWNAIGRLLKLFTPT
ncbi:transposase [Rhizobium sp. G21]|uniref:transposase n=1 Tax=Rhizobium sp. G21 TaxID=2758439 RepID=UPI00160119D0|nr:transposase [Rhizobium sp. G21]